MEFFFYLLFPLIVDYRWGLAATAVLWCGVAVAGVILYATYAMSPLQCYFLHAIYFGSFPPLRLVEFLAGIFGARLMMRETRLRSVAYWTVMELAAVALCVGGLLLLRAGVLHPIAQSVVNSISASAGFVLLIYACGHGRGPVSRLLAFRWVRYGGEISNSLYILHYAVQSAFVHLFGHAIDPLVRTLFYAAAIAAAALAYEALEVPCRRLIRDALTIDRSARTAPAGREPA